jgi:hypothetical protein
MQSSSLLETDGLQSESSDALMLPDAVSSFAASSAKLQKKIRKFYDIIPNTTMSPIDGDTNIIANEMVVVRELVDSPQQSMLAGEGETAGVWLVYDGNMTPNYGDEITVSIHSDPMLFTVGMIIEVAGDANITGAMSEADCNSYGWDNGWNSDPYIDPAGWLYLGGVSWEGVVNGTVGYFKFRYYGGDVTVSINEESITYDANCAPVLLSGQPLIFGQDPNG